MNSKSNQEKGNREMPMKKLASMSHILVNFFRYSLDLTTCNYVSLTLTVDVSMYIQSLYF